jgi:2-polyprenyl-3-methyl-5-hydroxy-6-metoxy-1,4-benzoquinol methylase
VSVDVVNLDLRDTAVEELMDDPACDADRLAATLRRFRVVNPLFSGWGMLYRSDVSPFLASLGRPARVLDLGCGGGDIAARLSAAAAREGHDVRWIGADPDDRAIAVASGKATDRLEFRRTDAATLRAEGERFDIVLSNHVIHHLGAPELAVFADDTLALSSGIVVHSDIRRSRLAYRLYAVGITPFAPGTFLRTDGLRSIRRSYHADELATALGSPWTVAARAPFRVVARAAGRG